MAVVARGVEWWIQVVQSETENDDMDPSLCFESSLFFDSMSSWYSV